MTRIVDGSSYAGQPFNPYKMRVYVAGAQNVARNTITQVNFDAVSFDTANAFNATNHNYAAPVAGYYQINACINIGMAPDANIYQYWSCFIYVNGVLTAYGNLGEWTQDAIGLGLNVSTIVADMQLLNSGDVVDIRTLYLTTTTPLALQTGSSTCYWSMHLISV